MDVRTKYSFLSKHLNLFGLFDSNRKWAKLIFIYGSILVTALFIASQLVYSDFVVWALNNFYGTSLLFILYVLSIVVCLDIKVDAEYEEDSTGNLIVKPVSKMKYRLIVAWGIFLLLGGIAFVVKTDAYRDKYIFMCCDCWIDKQKGVFHFFDNCQENSPYYFYMTKVHNINFAKYKPCKDCLYTADDYLNEYVDSPSLNSLYASTIIYYKNFVKEYYEKNR